MINDIFLKRVTKEAKRIRNEKKCDIVVMEDSKGKFESERFFFITLEEFYANKMKHTKAVCFLIYQGE